MTSASLPGQQHHLSSPWAPDQVLHAVPRHRHSYHHHTAPLWRWSSWTMRWPPSSTCWPREVAQQPEPVCLTPGQRAPEEPQNAEQGVVISVALGQVLSLLICGISLTSKYLSEEFHASTPVFQSFLYYILLFLVYTTTLAVRQVRATKTVEGAWAHLLLWELQNCNFLLSNHHQENVGSHQKKIPHVQGQRRSPNKMVGGAKSHLLIKWKCCLMNRRYF